MLSTASQSSSHTMSGERSGQVVPREVVVEESDDERHAEIVDALNVAARGMTVRPDVEESLQALQVNANQGLLQAACPRSSG